MKIYSFVFLLLFYFLSFAQTTKKITTKTTTYKTTTPHKKPVVKTQSLPANTQVWTIDAQRAKCEGIKTMQCLLVKKLGDKDFNLFYGDIDGFDYQEGFIYKIWVKADGVEKMTSTEGMPETKYRYVRTVSKKSIPGFNNTIVHNSKPLSGMNVTLSKIIVVNEDKAPCDGNPNSKCLLIKEENKKAFELFYQNIEGFIYEEGYRQTIVVTEHYTANAMVKQTDPVYTLVKVVSKEFIHAPKVQEASMPPKTTLDRQWFLRKMNDSDTTSFDVTDNVVWIQFNSAENKLNGNAPCNTYFGEFKSDLISSFSSSVIVNTKKYCSNIKFENIFFSLLQNADRFEIRNGRLTLFKGDRLLLVFE